MKTGLFLSNRQNYALGQVNDTQNPLWKKTPLSKKIVAM
jgi:hypothetical protein